MPPPLVTTQAVAETSSVNWIPAGIYALWAIGSVTLIISWWRRWRSLRAALQTASPINLPILPIGVTAMTSPAFAEPGVFGIRRPVLLLPAGITGRLTPLQLKAIVAHEQCHVRRRDTRAMVLGETDRPGAPRSSEIAVVVPAGSSLRLLDWILEARQPAAKHT